MLALSGLSNHRGSARGVMHNIWMIIASQKMTSKEEIYGRKLQGRPVKRWIEEVELDMRKTNVGGWQVERQDWRRIVGDAKIHTGL
jgi:hypothetical protein